MDDYEYEYIGTEDYKTKTNDEKIRIVKRIMFKLNPEILEQEKKNLWIYKIKDHIHLQN